MHWTGAPHVFSIPHCTIAALASCKDYLSHVFLAIALLLGDLWHGNVLILVEMQLGKDSQKSSTSEIPFKKLFFFWYRKVVDAGRWSIRFRGAWVALWQYHTASFGRGLLCFQLGILWRLVKKSRAQCVFGLVVHIVLCCTIWLSHQIAPGSNPSDPDPWNKWLLVHKIFLTTLIYKKDVWLSLLEEKLSANFPPCPFFGCLFRWTLLLNQDIQKKF